MAVCPQCQRQELGEERERKSLKKKLPGKSNRSRSGLKCAEESYEKSFSDITIFFYEAGYVCGVGHEEWWTSMGPRWEQQRCVGVFLHCGREATHAWIAHQPVNKTCNSTVRFVTKTKHCAKLGTVCSTPGNVPMSQLGWQCSTLVRVHLKLPPKLKVQAKLNHLGEVSFPVIWVFDSSLFSQGWWWETASLGIRNTQGIHWQSLIIALLYILKKSFKVKRRTILKRLPA